MFPDMLQILADNTNAETGRVPDRAGRAGDRPGARRRECFSEWLPTSGRGSASSTTAR